VVVFSLIKKLFRRSQPGLYEKVSFILAGIGNTGEKYSNTRHNIGFSVVDALLKKCEEVLREKGCHSEIVISRLPRGDIVSIVKPQTLVNRSGIAIKEVLKRYNLPLSSCLIIVDDFNLPLGKLRFRRSGTDGGHNGLRSIISEVGIDFARLRIGIGPLPENTDVVDFVLGSFEKQEIEEKDEAVRKAADAVLFFCESGIEAAMSKYNRNN